MEKSRLLNLDKIKAIEEVQERKDAALNQIIKNSTNTIIVDDYVHFYPKFNFLEPIQYALAGYFGEDSVKEVNEGLYTSSKNSDNSISVPLEEIKKNEDLYKFVLSKS